MLDLHYIYPWVKPLPEVRVVVVRVGAGVDNSVHVEVQVVKLRQLVLPHNLMNEGINMVPCMNESMDDEHEISVHVLSVERRQLLLPRNLI